MRSIIVHFDLFHVHGVLHTRHLVDLSKIIQNVGGRGDCSGICLEIHDIHLIETQQGYKKTNIRQRELIASNIPLPRQDFLRTIKRFSQLIDCNVIGALGRCEPTPVDPIINGTVQIA